MFRRSCIDGVLAIAMLGWLAAACGDPQTHQPVGPSAPWVATLKIEGPDTLPPGQSAQYTLSVELSDGTTKTLSAGSGVAWRSSSPLLHVDGATGLATASPGLGVGDAVLSANLSMPTLRQAAKEVVVVPAGTYRLVGLVSDAELPALHVAGARVDVTPGSLSATTGYDGRFQLYGVPADVEVRVTAEGYQPVAQRMHLGEHATRTFQLAPAVSRPDFTGAYTLALDAVGGCTPLPAELQHRRYDAVVTQHGFELDVTLTESRFALDQTGKGRRFSGEAGVAGATFVLDAYSEYDWWYGYQAVYPSLAERISDGTVLVVDGRATTFRSGSGLSGELDGAFRRWDSRFPQVGYSLGFCSSARHRFTLTPR
jgi:hypothetical protein